MLLKVMSEPTATIVIPIYNEQLDKNECISLLRALEVFFSRPLVFIAPESLNIEFYNKIIDNKHKNFMFKFFPQEYFRNIEGYNRLMLSYAFYANFSNAEYILIYHLDSYVFSDNLAKWCSQDYDYIGAPWLIRKDNMLFIDTFAGNGGFSLRRVSAFMQTLKSRRILVLNPIQVFREYSNHGIKSVIYKLPVIVARCFGYRNNSRFYIKNNAKKEDIFWANVAPMINKRFKSIKGIDAISFAFDKYPSFLYKLNNKQLPFGCHRWYKNGLMFWSKFIPQN